MQRLSVIHDPMIRRISTMEEPAMSEAVRRVSMVSTVAVRRVSRVSTVAVRRISTRARPAVYTPEEPESMGRENGANSNSLVIQNKTINEKELADNEIIEEKDDRSMSQMGIFGWRPRFLEFMNQPIVFVVFFGIGNLFTVMSFGVLSVYLTTLEKTFNLNSKETGVILLGNDISGLFASLLLANYCSSKKIRWIALGMFAVVISCLLPAMATLFAEYPELDQNAFIPNKDGVTGTCNLGPAGPPPPQGVADYAINNHGLFWLFVAGSLVLGIGGSPPGIAGPTYMDEMYTQKEFGVAISILYIITFVGFPLSVLFGASTLETYVTLSPPEGMHPGRPEWVGAWWLGFLVPAIVIFFVSFIVVLFPTQMPAAKRVLSEKIKKGITTVSEKKTELHRSLAEITKDTVPVAKRILTNKSLNCLVFGDAFIFLQIGSISYLPKMYAIAFRLGFSEVGQVIGISNVVAFVLGLVLGGAIMRVKDWHPKKLLLIYSVAVLVSSPFQASLFLRCDSNTWGGVDVRYPNHTGTGEATLVDTCNVNCKCNTAFPSPVCDTTDGTTYFSQCHAGCMGGELNDPADMKSGVLKYTDCKCAEGRDVIPGECGQRCQTKLYISLALSVFGTMINFSGYAAHATVYQRVVNEADRTVAQGWRQFVTRVLGTLPAPIVFGYIIDNACTIWRNVGGKQGNCWVYDLDSLLLWFVMVQILLRIISSAFYFLGWYLYPVPTKEEKEKYEGGCTEYEMTEQNTNGAQQLASVGI